MLNRALGSLVWVCLCLGAAGKAEGAQLNYGKYFGTIQMDGRAEAIAVSLDAFVVQIKDPTVYPAVNVIIRANLGGFSSSEYVGYNFYDPTFNFEKSVLQLDDPKNDLSATLQVTNTDTQTILEGPVIHRMTNSKGKMRVVMNVDDGVTTQSASESLPLVSILRGEYRGVCGNDQADLQIETGRGLGASSPGNALNGYSITGRLGLANGPLCFPGAKYCSQAPFSTGTYSPFSGRLTMQGPLGTIDCNKQGDDLTCKLLLYNNKGSCKLTKKTSAPTPAVQAPASIFLQVPGELKKPLPSPVPPDNTELIKALNGDFYGFLHFENRDLYQMMQLNVVATTSTENPHIQNQVMVTPTLYLRLGSSWNSQPALSLFYPQRVFWLNEGFAFQDDTGDLFTVIEEWKMGYISGVLYSKSFGRVGTFELRKGSAPDLPQGMKLVASPLGEFQGPVDSGDETANVWSLSLEAPNQVPGPGETGLPLLGRFGGPGLMNMFDNASMDLLTGELSFLIKNPKGDRLVIGEASPDGRLSLLWPVGPALGAPMSGYGFFHFVPAKQK